MVRVFDVNYISENLNTVVLICFLGDKTKKKRQPLRVAVFWDGSVKECYLVSLECT